MHFLLVPAFFPLFFFFCVPIAIIMSIIGTQFRDVKHISLLAMQALFFLSPVMLNRTILEQPQLHFLHYVNPMVPMFDLLRGPLFDGKMWDPTELIVIGMWTAALWTCAFILQAQAGRKLVFAI
jgi:ABC-type polysaccharide/polyol phosphate export permease